jgi:hypothetical protein
VLGWEFGSWRILVFGFVFKEIVDFLFETRYSGHGCSRLVVELPGWWQGVHFSNFMEGEEKIEIWFTLSQVYQ